MKDINFDELDAAISSALTAQQGKPAAPVAPAAPAPRPAATTSSARPAVSRPSPAVSRPAAVEPIVNEPVIAPTPASDERPALDVVPVTVHKPAPVEKPAAQRRGRFMDFAAAAPVRQTATTRPVSRTGGTVQPLAPQVSQSDDTGQPEAQRVPTDEKQAPAGNASPIPVPDTDRIPVTRTPPTPAAEPARVESESKFQPQPQPTPEPVPVFTALSSTPFINESQVEKRPLNALSVTDTASGTSDAPLSPELESAVAAVAQADTSPASQAVSTSNDDTLPFATPPSTADDDMTPANQLFSPDEYHAPLAGAHASGGRHLSIVWVIIACLVLVGAAVAFGYWFSMNI